jgi:hypothetical protein
MSYSSATATPTRAYGLRIVMSQTTRATCTSGDNKKRMGAKSTCSIARRGWTTATTTFIQKRKIATRADQDETSTAPVTGTAYDRITRNGAAAGAVSEAIPRDLVREKEFCGPESAAARIFDSHHTSCCARDWTVRLRLCCGACACANICGYRTEASCKMVLVDERPGRTVSVSPHRPSAHNN